MMKYSQQRRRLLQRLTLGLGALVLPIHRVLSASTVSNPFDTSEFVYISPMQSNGDESSCHGEVWFAWVDDQIVIVTGKDSWKYQALARGLDQAFVWVGNYGRWRGWFGRRNNDFKQSPRLVARASESRDEKLLDQMLAQFAVKYPEEFNDWEAEQRDGFLENRRTLIVYELRADSEQTRT